MPIRWSLNTHPFADPSGWLDPKEDDLDPQIWSPLIGIGPLRLVRIDTLSLAQATLLASIYTQKLQGLAQIATPPSITQGEIAPSPNMRGETALSPNTQGETALSPNMQGETVLSITQSAMLRQGSAVQAMHCVYLDGDPLRIHRLLGVLEQEACLEEVGRALAIWWENVRRVPLPWSIRGYTLDWTKAPVLMGIVNVTPDSFSDGGRYLGVSAAVEHGLRLVEEGAMILDVGGESTRPGASAVSAAEELERVLPVIEGLRQHTAIPLSIDTYKPMVARAALTAGADIVNDISGLRFAPELAEVTAQMGAFLILMHSRHTPQAMQDAPHYDALWSEICAELSVSLACATSAGVPLSRIALDPGIGFGKRYQDNLRILRETAVMRGFGCPILIGASRKSFLGRLLDGAPPAQRLEGSLAAVAAALQAGAQIVRVHDVRETKKLLAVLSAILISSSEI